MTFAETSRLLRRMIALSMTSTVAYPFDFFCYMFGAVFGPLIAALVWRAAIESGIRDLGWGEIRFVDADGRPVK